MQIESWSIFCYINQYVHNAYRAQGSNYTLKVGHCCTLFEQFEKSNKKIPSKQQVLGSIRQIKF